MTSHTLEQKAKNNQYTLAWLYRNRVRQALYNKEYDHLNKVKVMMHYSNPEGAVVCNNCGEQDIDVLCIDHIEGGGTAQRKKIRQNTHSHMLHIIRNNYPEDYQILCANCNMKKSWQETRTPVSLSKAKNDPHHLKSLPKTPPI